ncbi:hypothetical protein F444_19784 [Phytophthora nicotianae P1976]|uniref:Uncharacterized protein n=1 Tax=Phytophthora nicotianae P1976 TaxID=1317066 RepID=A0A080Z6M6_PHYNI|nr:hypothetical protein F444_19784 [Phytophthora nicotianae P1976]
MALYDALEYVSCGPVGLFLLLLLFNALNMAFSIDRNALGYSRCSRLERTRQVNGTLPYAFVPNKPTPNACELRTVIPVTTTQLLMARLPTTQSSKEASPPDILDDFTAVEVFVVDVLRGLRTLSQRPAEASATTAPARAYRA